MMKTTDSYDVLPLSGDLNFSGASFKRQELLDLLSASENIEIDLSGIKEFDCVGMQLLYAAIKSGQKQKKSIRFKGGDNTERFLKFLKFSGLGESLPLLAEKNETEEKEE